MSKEDLTPFDSERARAAGRKSKRGRSFKTIFRELIDQELDATNPITKLKEKYTAGEVIGMQQLAKALKGDDRAAKLIMDRLEGMPEQIVKDGNVDLAHLSDKELKEYERLTNKALGNTKREDNKSGK